MMKKFLLIILCLIGVSVPMSAQMLVGSYNIRLKVSSDSVKGNVWQKRCQVICDQVNFMSPDIFGAQEVLHVQLLDMLQGLDGYDYIGVGRDDGKTGGEYAAIFYKPDRLRLLDQGNFWLSETPDRPGLGWDAACVRVCTWGRFAGQTATDDEAFYVFNLHMDHVGVDETPDVPKLGWDAACIRICTWGKFVDSLTTKEFYFFNLHMDHVGVVARREGAKLIVRKIREIAQGAPVIVTGDFNVDQKDEIYSIFTESGLLKDSYLASRLRFAENGTFNSFDTELYTDSRIDHIFVSPDTEVESYGVLTNSYWMPNDDSAAKLKGHDAPQQIDFSKYTRRQPSDHYPVFVRLSLGH